MNRSRVEEFQIQACIGCSLLNSSIFQPYYPVCVFGMPLFVGNHYNCLLLFPVEFLEKVKDFLWGLGVQIGAGLVCKKDSWGVGKSSSYWNSLLLAAAHFWGKLLQAITRANGGKNLCGCRLAFGFAFALHHKRYRRFPRHLGKRLFLNFLFMKRLPQLSIRQEKTLCFVPGYLDRGQEATLSIYRILNIKNCLFYLLLQLWQIWRFNQKIISCSFR